jgi:putative intracellular protease/amidase
VLLIIAAQDFYYPEYGPVRNILELKGVECRVASTTLDECLPNEKSPMIPVTPDLLLADAKAADFDAIYFCGGEGSLEFAEGGSHFAEAKRLIQEALATRCTVGAVGLGVVALAEADVMRGKKAAGYPFGSPPGIYLRRISARGVRNAQDAVAVDGPFITGAAPQDVRLFAETLLKRLGIEPPVQPATEPRC